MQVDHCGSRWSVQYGLVSEFFDSASFYSDRLKTIWADRTNMLQKKNGSSQVLIPDKSLIRGFHLAQSRGGWWVLSFVRDALLAAIADSIVCCRRVLIQDSWRIGLKKD